MSRQVRIPPMSDEQLTWLKALHESESKMTVMIPQRYDGEEQRKDCFFCCACMALGWPYEDAYALLTDELKECIGPKGVGPRGTQCDEILKLLAGLDRVMVGARTGDPSNESGDYCLFFMQPEYATNGFLRNMLWGRRALVQVTSKNYVGEQHIIYWDGVKLFDPSTKRKWLWHEVEPIYLWLFNERDKEHG